MTSTTDTAGHPDVTEISDLTEGLLTPSRTADVQRHLDECVLCADVYASLEEIRGLFGSMPNPVHMPDDVVGRIDAALAAEVPLNTPVSVGAAGAVSGETEGTHVSRETSPPSERLTDRPTGHAHAATGPGRKDRTRLGRRRSIVLGTVFTAAALGLGSLLVSSLGDDTKQSEAVSTFAGQKVENQVAELLKGQDLEKNTRSGVPSVGVQINPDDTTTGENEGTVKIKPTPAPACVIKGIGRGNTRVLGIKQGSYDGTDAYLVVLPAAGDDTRVTAYVVDSACTKQPSAPPGEVLLTHSYARS
ncbi:anti-sigma factor [Streptomyces sp. NBC_00280]|uniref:anti-sigma factor family protein n=1 Tax=Streptomyces sp. NBC_00280 TaxID=2975699 RepID=UPI0032490CC6